MKRWLVIAFGVLWFGSAHAQQVGVLTFGSSPAPIPYIIGPVDPGNGQANLNSVIQEIDNVLGISFPQVPGAVNTPTFGESVAGQPVIIGASGTDTNIPILIQPKGSGNIELFGQGQTGVLSFNNQFSFLPATGIAACPGFPPNGAYASNLGIGVKSVVTGAIWITDWMNRPHALPVCG